jgi:hypothetical protein
MSFATITLCVASQRVFIVVSVYFLIDSVRRLLNTHLYIDCNDIHTDSSPRTRSRKEKAAKVKNPALHLKDRRDHFDQEVRQSAQSTPLK